ncbi:MAG: hydroxymethylglutaryl-CoA lyase [Rickettsiales bacterium]|nr:hydroxymethylglutaryl-CoA lyase [Rickettsiales bacterium]|tara:strand:- start:1043 stop:1936 length:894 start_codon:yes stop_codon:yes gene_type:complete
MSDNFVKLVEVGPRDGLQNEKNPVSVQTKVDLINRLSDCGFRSIEAGAFVSPKWVPQMASSDLVFNQIHRQAQISYPMLVPNEKGLELALEAGVKEIAVFTAASNAFCLKNINCTIDESLEKFENVIKKARQNEIKVRGYVSTIVACPYSGKVKEDVVLDVSKQLINMGVYEVSLGDTIGVGTIGDIERILDKILPEIKHNKLALHLHDTYGQALANIAKGLEMGIRVFDTSVGGLGGCPYAKGATGNVASEDVAYMLNGMGYKTDINLDKLIKTSHWICKEIGRENGSKVARAKSL